MTDFTNEQLDRIEKEFRDIQGDPNSIYVNKLWSGIKSRLTRKPYQPRQGESIILGSCVLRKYHNGLASEKCSPQPLSCMPREVENLRSFVARLAATAEEPIPVINSALAELSTNAVATFDEVIKP